MAYRTNPSKKPDFGLIILGNAGAGKSFICNLIIGSERFEADFQPEAVTTATEHHRLKLQDGDCLIYNIPGLVEVTQTQIDRNKREIMRAFEECPSSIVIFVWTQIGGRAQNDDVIAFNALNDAYKFPLESLMFVVNNIPEYRPPEYDGRFLALLNNAIKSVDVTKVDTIFVNSLNPTDLTQKKHAREKLIKHITVHPVHSQRKQQDIMLQSDQLNEMRNMLKRQQEQSEKDRARLERQIAAMVEEHKRSQAEANKAYEKLAKENKRSRAEAKKVYKKMTEQQKEIQAEAKRAHAKMEEPENIEKKATSYKNPLECAFDFIDSTVQFTVGATKMVGIGLADLLDEVTGTDRDEVSRRDRNAARGTAAARVYGPND